MSTWRTVRVRSDLYWSLERLAHEQSRSVAGQLDFILGRTLDREPRTDGVQTSDGSSTLSASDRASAQEVPAGPQPPPPADEASGALRGRGVEDGVNGGGGAAQITIDEALKRCPVCNDSLDDEQRCVDPECASHRVAS